jgi:glycosyltransferase involved in cell wall biosynthesis
MKLLAISSWFPYPPDNGAKLRAYHLLTQLAGPNEVTLLSFAEPGEERGIARLEACFERVVTVAGNPFKPARPLGRRDLFSGIPRSYAQTYSPQMQALVDREIPGHDVALALEIGAALYLAYRSDIPRVLDEIEVGAMLAQYRSQPAGFARARKGLTWWKYVRFITDLVRRFDGATVVSALERNHLADMGCDMERIHIVANGVSRADLLSPNVPRPGTLIYPGSITYSANLDAVQYFLAEIFPRILAVRPEVTLQVTGSTGDIDVATLSRNPAVTFTGRVDDVKPLITGSAVCVVPLRKGGGTRLKILESMALGTPVVATSKGAEGLTVTPGHDILIGDAPDTFAAQVLRVLGDRLLRTRLAANGRSLVDQGYTWDRVGTQLDALLREVHARVPRQAATQIAEGSVQRAAGA